MGFFAKRIDQRIAAYQHELIETHYREVDNMYHQIRGWRHDYRNHIQTMKAYAASGDLDAIKRYLDLLDEDIFVCLKAWAGAFGVGSVAQYVSAITSLSTNLGKLLSTWGELRGNAVILKTTFEFLDMAMVMFVIHISVMASFSSCVIRPCSRASDTLMRSIAASESLQETGHLFLILFMFICRIFQSNQINP